MNIHTAIGHLDKLVIEGDNDLVKYAKASALISALDEENRTIVEHELIDPWVGEKINRTKRAFMELCGVTDISPSSLSVLESAKDALYHLRYMIGKDNDRFNPPRP